MWVLYSSAIAISAGEFIEKKQQPRGRRRRRRRRRHRRRRRFRLKYSPGFDGHFEPTSPIYSDDNDHDHSVEVISFPSPLPSSFFAPSPPTLFFPLPTKEKAILYRFQNVG